MGKEIYNGANSGTGSGASGITMLDITPELEYAIFHSADAFSEIIKDFQKKLNISADGIAGYDTRYAYGLVAQNGGVIDEKVVAQARAFEKLPTSVKQIDFEHLASIEPSEYAPVQGRDAVITSPFAYRKIDKGSANHYKADYRGRTGNGVVAPYDMRVTAITRSTYEGTPITSITYKTNNGLTVKDVHVLPTNGLRIGDKIEAGETFATIAPKSENGGFTPHLDRGYQLTSVIYTNAKLIHTEFEPSDTDVANRDKNIFYDISTRTWITEESLAAAGIDTRSLGNLSNNSALIAATTNTPPMFNHPSLQNSGTMIAAQDSQDSKLESHMPTMSDSVKEQALAAAAATNNIDLPIIDIQPKTLSFEPNIQLASANLGQSFAAPNAEDFYQFYQYMIASSETPTAKEAEEKVHEMFARFNGENGATIVVKQTYDKLSPKERAAAILVQKSLNLLGEAEIPVKELGHVAGGKTKMETEEYQAKKSLVVDGEAGKNTYAALEKDLIAKMENSPELRNSLVSLANEMKAEYMKTMVAEAEALPNTIPNAAELAVNQSPSTGQDVGRA